MPKKLYIKLMGGLGNQLFQLAAGLSAVKNHRIEPVLMLGKYASVDARFYELECLENALGISSQLFVNPFVIPHKIKETREFEFQKIEINPSRNNQLEGYFQNPNYVKNCRDELVEAYVSAGKRSEKNLGCKCLKDHIGLHMRRGDYLLPRNRNLLGVLHDDYFEQIASEFRDAHISIFTDGAADSGIRQIANESDVYGGDFSAWWTLSKMASMDTLIVSNSSLSWWAAYIGQSLNPDQIVISPRNWFRALPGSASLVLKEWNTRESVWVL